jgi:hypothetical protein
LTPQIGGSTCEIPLLGTPEVGKRAGRNESIFAERAKIDRLAKSATGRRGNKKTPRKKTLKRFQPGVPAGGTEAVDPSEPE